VSRLEPIIVADRSQPDKHLPAIPRGEGFRRSIRWTSTPKEIDATGRPVPITDHGRLIARLFA
jgi:hypothetical protein